MKLLKGRPEVHRLYTKLKSRTKDGKFDVEIFEQFMRDKQGVSCSRSATGPNSLTNDLCSRN